MKTLATTVLISSLALAGFSQANADDDRYEKRGYHGEHHGEHCDRQAKGNRLERMKQHLGLSDEQVEKMRSVREKYQPQKQALREKMRDTRKQLREVMQADNIDQRAVKKLANKVGDLKAEKIVLRARMRSEINAILTPEQRQKMREWKQRRYQHHDHDEHQQRHHN